MDYTPFIEIARERSSQDPAHDFAHVARVVKNAQRMMQKEKADAEVVIPAILLHELFNYPKDHPESRHSGDVCAEEARVVLDELDYPLSKRDMVLDCIRFHAFSRGVTPEHLEGKIVQDADRLDAIGAIGIARLFATCAGMNRPFYDVTDPFSEHRDLNDHAYGVDHFYTKLFKLASGMHTETAREMAVERTTFMHEYIQQLRSEIHTLGAPSMMP